MARTILAIIGAGVVADGNAVLEAWGKGPNAFVRKVCADEPGVTSATPATHYLLNDSSATENDIAVFQAMADRVLPPLASGAWGEDGLISAADALDAVSADSLQAYSYSGDADPAEHMNGILAGRGLRLVPDAGP